ncbi:AraC family transcriptional regulator [Chitinophaga nivalis]|uniref:AraC family transcriptional regulator n=1 Tax=Chitinophaga nivalis TaxID=2991709 RepID=A0ABT3INB1_9BACT|nr:AraC family transcriptional regulator [Chitinophaga nivalis]MCW3464846.1 AraC family transcriptional regulator [Chitinophaga nivalis]MCW3485463.1 AraC family transcriptional regulator [Chitinophaga nivalis]
MSALRLSGEYYGTTRKTIHISGIRLSHQQYSPLSSSPVHAHQREHLCYTLAGTFREVTSRNNQLIAAGELLIYPKQREHQTIMQQQYRSCLFIEFNDDWLERLRDHHIRFDHFTVIRQADVSQLFSRIYQEFSHPGEAAPLLLEGLLIESAVTLSRQPAADKKLLPSQIRKIRDLLQSDIAQKWTLSDLATRLDFHPVYLNRLFKQHTGQTIHQYLEDIRIAQVCHLLKHSSNTISDIAYACGFTDPSHLHKVFLKKKGIRPLAYKSQA